MGVYIKNIKMPIECDYCPFSGYDERQSILFCRIDNEDIEHDLRDDCPLIDIVTCGECKYYYPYKHYDGRILGYHCQAPNQQTDFLNPTHYCGFGERRTE